MTSRKKRSPRWRVAFLRALRVSRNVRQAAWAAGVDHGTAYNHRKRDAGFAAEWDEALQAGSGSGAGRSESPEPADAPEARESPGAAGAPLDPSTSLRGAYARDERNRKRNSRSRAGLAGEYVIRSSVRSGPQLVRAAAGRWSKKAERVFLGELADHSNVRRAAAACGLSTTALYNRRMNDPVFAAKWAAAKECGRERIDLYLIEIANRTLDPDAFEVRDDLPKVTVAEAIQILKLHQASDRGQLGAKRKAAREPSIEAVKDEILRRLAAIRRHREQGRRGKEGQE